MKNKNLVVGAAVVIILGMAAFGGYKLAESRKYVVTAADISDRFPIKAKEVKDNPQLAVSDGPYAILHTTAGDITILLYPDQAPKAVENFITLAKEGYYDNSKFWFVKKNSIAQVGKPDADNPAAETMDLPKGEKPLYGLERSIWETPFEDEFDDLLHNFTGAVGMAGDGKDNNLSQFYFILSEEKAEDKRIIPTTFYYNELTRLRINEFNQLYQTATASEADILKFEETLNEELQAIPEKGIPTDFMNRYQKAIDRYEETGGMWGLDYKQTVFAQVVKGLNVAEAITEVMVDPSTRKPKKDIIIESIEIIEK